MGSFSERAAEYQRNRDANFRRMINEAAQPSGLAEARTAFTVMSSQRAFMKAGLHDFLLGSVEYAKSHGHDDARIDFDFIGIRTDIKEDGQEDFHIEGDDAYTVAVATFKMDFVPGQVAEGYTYYEVNLYPYGHRLVVSGKFDRKFPNFDSSNADVEKTIVEAYFTPGKRPPLDVHPENG